MYLTFYRRTEQHLYPFEQMYLAYMSGESLPYDSPLPYPRTHTVQVETAQVSTPHFTNMLVELANLDAKTGGLSLEYTQFLIPKHSGGYRTINAPNDQLKEFQRLFTKYLRDTCKFLTHDSAFAYVPKRCPKHALQRHQDNKWFLKLDIKNFFPSITFDFVRETLYELHPFASMKEALQRNNWEQILHYCFLDGVLPQGSPASPILSNLAMIPFDLTISRLLQNFQGFNFTYTRYADDLLITCPYHFDHTKVVDAVQNIIKDVFQINTEKTRYGSSSGRNWNLGLMLNKDQQITVGHKRKERTKAMMFNIMKEGTSTQLTVQELQVLQGELAYIESIEPEYIHNLDRKYIAKLHVPSYKQTISHLLKTRTA